MRAFALKSFCAIGLMGLSLSAPAAGTMVAEQITASNANAYVQNGPDASAGIGDWILSNGTLCVTLAALDHEGDFSARGGTLRDIGFCHRDDDHFVSGQDLLNGSQSQPVDISAIQASHSRQKAALVTLGENAGMMIETRYSLSAEAANRLKINKRIWRKNDDAADPGIFSSLSFNYHSLETFLLSTHNPSRSNGFKQEKFVGRSSMAFTQAARKIDVIVMLSPHDAVEPIAYGWRLLSAHRQSTDGGDRVALPSFALADRSALAFVTLVEPLTIGDGENLGLVQLLQVPFLGLELGQEIHIEEEIIVAPSHDVAAITDDLYAHAARVSGQVVAGAGQKTSLHIDRKDGAPFTQLTPDADGQFSAHLPAGDYQFRLLSRAGQPIETAVSVAADDVHIGTLSVPPAARIDLPRGTPMRLIFRGTNGTPDPHLEDQLTGYGEAVDGQMLPIEAATDVHLAATLGDPTHVYLSPGSYQIYSARGPEFSVETTTLTVADGQAQKLNIQAPRRLVETPGFMAADLHVHSGPSFDNAFSTHKRLRSFIAEHGEVMVAAEHDTIFDFNPLLAQIGASDKMIAITGSEVTSTLASARAPHTIGHMNFFPLERQAHAYRRGLPAHENRRTRDVLYDMHVGFGAPFAQLNHARENLKLSGDLPDDYQEAVDDEAFFTHMGAANHPFNPTLELTQFPNNSLIERDPVTGFRDIDFDAMELMNGSQAYRPERTQSLRRDWHALLSQGERISGSANSDSHGTTQQVALPRNMVRLAADTVADFSIDGFTNALRQGDFYGTTGPFFDLSLSGTGMGGTHQGSTGTLSGRVFSADWVDVDRLDVQINGNAIGQAQIADDGHFSMPIEVTGDAYVTIEISGQASDIYQAVYPGYFPYAYSNPIYIDANSDGQWTPPGLSVPLTEK